MEYLLSSIDCPSTIFRMNVNGIPVYRNEPNLRQTSERFLAYPVTVTALISNNGIEMISMMGHKRQIPVICQSHLPCIGTIGVQMVCHIISLISKRASLEFIASIISNKVSFCILPYCFLHYIIVQLWKIATISFCQQRDMEAIHLKKIWKYIGSFFDLWH